jgi:hypothetical protein
MKKLQQVKFRECLLLISSASFAFPPIKKHIYRESVIYIRDVFIFIENGLPLLE